MIYFFDNIICSIKYSFLAFFLAFVIYVFGRGLDNSYDSYILISIFTITPLIFMTRSFIIGFKLIKKEKIIKTNIYLEFYIIL